MRFLLILAMLFGATSCAFKDPPEEQEDEISTGLRASVSWSVGEDAELAPRTEFRSLVINGDRTWSLDRAVTLPSEVPNRIVLTLELPLNEEELESARNGRIRANGRLLDGALNGPTEPRDRPLLVGNDLTVETPDPHTLRLRVPLVELRTLIPDDSQKILRFTILIHNVMGLTLAQVTGQLQTPPSLLRVAQTTLVDYLNRGGEVAEEFRNLQSASLNLKLLQIATVHNSALSPVEVSFPSRPEGAILKSRFERRKHQDKGCGYEVVHEDSVDTLSDGIFLMPEKSIRDEFDLQSSAPEISRTVRAVIPPGEILRIGLYASGGELDSIADGTREGSDFLPVTVPGRCFWWCRGGLPRRTSRKYCWNCNKRKHAVRHINDCNRCYNSEPNGGHVSDTFCYADWVRDRETVSVQLGLKTHPVLLSMPPDTIQIGFRWPGGWEARQMPWPYLET